MGSPKDVKYFGISLGYLALAMLCLQNAGAVLIMRESYRPSIYASTPRLPINPHHAFFVTPVTATLTLLPAITFKTRLRVTIGHVQDTPALFRASGST